MGSISSLPAGVLAPDRLLLLEAALAKEKKRQRLAGPGITGITARRGSGAGSGGASAGATSPGGPGQHKPPRQSSGQQESPGFQKTRAATAPAAATRRAVSLVEPPPSSCPDVGGFGAQNLGADGSSSLPASDREGEHLAAQVSELQLECAEVRAALAGAQRLGAEQVSTRTGRRSNI